LILVEIFNCRFNINQHIMGHLAFQPSRDRAGLIIRAERRSSSWAPSRGSQPGGRERTAEMQEKIQEIWIKGFKKLKQEWDKKYDTFLNAYVQTANFPKIDTKSINGLLEQLVLFEVTENAQKIASSLDRRKVFLGQYFSEFSELKPGEIDDTEAFKILSGCSGLVSQYFNKFQTTPIDEALQETIPLFIEISNLTAIKMGEFRGYWKASMKVRRRNKKNPTKRTEKNLETVSQILNENDRKTAEDRKTDKAIIRDVMQACDLSSSRRARDLIKMAQENKSRK